MPPAIVFDQISKQYADGLFMRRSVQALKDVSLEIDSGEVFGLVGPNRAGKSTLVKILLSLCRPTGGRAFRLGQPVTDPRTLARVGYMHENQAFPRYLSATELLHYCGALAFVNETELGRRVPALLERVGLTDRAHEPIARFSKGMVQRLGLAQALVNAPQLLVLDEPSEGLDLPGRLLVRDVVREMKQQGKTVLLVSHVLGEVERLCDRVGILVGGRQVHVGTLADLTRDSSGTSRPLEHTLRELYAARR